MSKKQSICAFIFFTLLFPLLLILTGAVINSINYINEGSYLFALLCFLLIGGVAQALMFLFNWSANA